MLLVALSFLYVFFVSAEFGIAANKWFGIRNSSPFITVMTGLFAVSMGTCLWAFFFRVNWEFQTVLTLSAIGFASYHRSDSAAFYHAFASGIRELSGWLKILFGFNFLLILARSAMPPFLPDNESYYIQTIKWLNEYGLVPGLANLHFFLGQTSGWHIAQSAFSFPFWYDRFNDLSGFALLMGNGFALLRLQDYLKSGSFNNLVFGLFGLGNVLWFQFIGAPSPDLPVYVLAMMACWLFSENYAKPTASGFRQMCLLLLFALFIKLTPAPLLILPLLILNRIKTASLRTELALIGACAITVFAYISKNLMLTGYPIFPMPWLGSDADHSVPGEIVSWFAANARPAGFGLSASQLSSDSFLSLLRHWLTLPGLHGLFNLISTLLLVIPLRLLWIKKDAAWWWLYICMVLQWVFLFAYSPQYRFGLHFTALFGLFILAVLLEKWKQVNVLLLTAATAVSALPLFTPLGMASVSENALFLENPVFSSAYLISPHPVSSEPTSFSKQHLGKLDFYSPNAASFFWFTGNGPLPCVSEEQLRYFEVHFHYRPQPIGPDPGDGFQSVKTDSVSTEYLIR